MSRSATPILATMIAACAVSALSSCAKTVEAASGPDDQLSIRTAIDTYFAGIAGDYDAFASVLCPDLADELLSGLDEPTFEVRVADDIQANGRPIVDWFDTVAIDGATAEVTLSVHILGGSAPDVGPQKWTAGLERDGDAWAVCTAAAPDRATQRMLDVAVDERDAQAVVQQFYDALAGQDLATAESVSCDPLRSQLPADDPAAYESVEKLISIDGVTVNGDAARVPATVELPDGTQLPLNYVVTRDRAGWKVCDAV